MESRLRGALALYLDISFLKGGLKITYILTTKLGIL